MSAPQIQYSGPPIDPEIPWPIRQHIQLLYQRIGNQTQGIGILHQDIENVKAGANTRTIVEGGVGGGGGGGSTTMAGIVVNNQSGATSYTTVSGDNLALLIFSDASGVAVSLAGQQPPYGFFATNLGVGAVTFTPGSGTVNGGATFILPVNYTTIVAFDGTNWWAADFPVVPENTPPIASEWINSYDSATGVFGQSQPAIADVSGLSAALALLAPLASPALTGIPTAPTAPPLTNDTEIATTAYSDAAVAVEKSRAEAAEGLLAPLASPTFTGTVTEPAPAVLTAASTATSATAGAATALPATPAGYLEMSVNGITVKIPYFSV